MPTFQPNPNRALVERFGEQNYSVTLPSGHTVGASTRAAAERYARRHGCTPEYVDRRKPRLKVLGAY